MSYNYATERPRLFTESGVKMLVQIRDNTKRLLATAGAFRADKAWEGTSGSTWTMAAALDYMVECKELKRVTQPGETWGQNAIFTGVNT